MYIARSFVLLCPILAHALLGATRASAAAPAYPLTVSDNGRYLVDARGTPFLIAGESPQAMMVNCSADEAAMFFANRRSHGFNTVWINLLCRKGTGGREDGSTYDDLRPFNTPGDLSTPNDAYFARCERIMELAAKDQFLVLLDPCETIDHLQLMVSNGPEKCRGFGRYLGRRFKRFDNLMWMSGNDFQTTLMPGHSSRDGKRNSIRPAPCSSRTSSSSSSPARHELVPDQKHDVVTAGYGTFDPSTTPGSAYGMTSDYVTTARWYDPSAGTFKRVDGSPLPNTGNHNFIPPGNNAGGDGDWVLVLETVRAPTENP